MLELLTPLASASAIGAGKKNSFTPNPIRIDEGGAARRGGGDRILGRRIGGSMAGDSKAPQRQWG